MRFLEAAGCLLLLSACMGGLQSATPTGMPGLVTSTSTATINWFPATSTHTPIPTLPATPTPQNVPGLGELILTDGFDEASPWTNPSSPSGNSLLNNHQLILTLTGDPQGNNISSLRLTPSLSDFYLEVQAHLSLCRGRDQYSLLFRITSAQDFYRYSASCSGELRLERVVGGKPFVIVDWLPSPDVPAGAPGEVKMGVWARGRDLQFYMNDRFEFTVNDTSFAQGGLGFYIKTDTASPMTVGFSDLSIYEVMPPTPTSSPAGSFLLTPSRTP